MTLSGTGHPEDVPAERIAALEDSSERELRERSDGTDEARGPFAYRVKWEPHIDDEGGRYRWHYLGKVYEDRRRFG